MKNLKRVIALVLTLAMVFCLCACGAKEDTKTANKITIFQQKAEIAEQLKALAAEYTKETGVEVEVWAQAGDDYYANLKTSLSSESGPSIFTLNSDAEITEVKDYLADLSSLKFIGDIDSALLAVRDDKTVGIPMTAEGFGLVYNADLVKVDELTSMDALCALIEKNGKDLTTVGLSQEDYFLAGHMFNFPFAVQADPVAFCAKVMAGEVKLADVAEFQQYAQLLATIRANQVNPVEVTYDNNCGDFATGKTAMVHQGNWAYGVMKDFNPSFEMGITGVPINGNNKIAVGVPSVWAVNADASDAEQKLALDFLNWLYTSETGIHYMMDEFGFIPVVKGMENKNMDPLSAAVAEKIASGDILPWTFNTEWPAGIISEEFAPITQKFFTSNMSEKELLNALNDAFLKYAK